VCLALFGSIAKTGVRQESLDTIPAAWTVMPDHLLELEGFSIVVLGSFNPSIFQPLWLSTNNLIRTEEAKGAKIEIIHRNVSIFATEWFSLQVTDVNFSLESSDPTKTQPLRDLALGVFKILEHTPLTAFGINCHRHFRMSSVESWHAFGHHFAPKESWNNILEEPGLRSMVMQGKRANCNALILIQVEPSHKITPGVFINVNEHHDLSSTKDASPADRNRILLSALQSSWDDFFSYSSRVSDHLFSVYNAPARHQPKKRRS
jgi:hypothetical protein